MDTASTSPKNSVLAQRMQSSYDESMPNITIRNVDPTLHEALKRKADAAGQSLQEYLTRQLEVIATTRTNAEIMRDHWEKMKAIDEPPYTREEIDQALALAKEERDNRWKRWL